MSTDALRRRLLAVEQSRGSGSKEGMLAKLREARQRCEAGEPPPPLTPLPDYMPGESGLLTKIRAAHKRVERWQLEGDITVDTPTSGPQLPDPLNADNGQLPD